MAREWTITLEDANNAPYETVEQENKISGLHFEMVEAVAKIMGVKIIWVPLPWRRSIKEIEEGKIDAFTFVTPTPERNKFMYFRPQNVLHKGRDICVITHPNNKNRKFNGTLESLYGSRVGLLEDYLLSTEIESHKKKFKTQFITGDTKQLLTMLLAERFDYTFSGNNHFAKIHAQPKFKKLIILKPCFQGEARFIAFSKKVPGYELKATQFEAALVNWKQTAEYRKLLEKYHLEN